MSVRFGLIGCGRMGEKHAAIIASLSEGRLVAVSDLDPERMEVIERIDREISGRSERLIKEADPSAMIHHPEIDVIIIATSSDQHGKLAISALQAGKHVMVEKPMALHLDEAEEMVRLSREKGKYLLVCHQLRYRPAFQKMKEWLDAGRLGELYTGTVTMHITRPVAYYRTSPWRGRWDTDGGLIINQGIHLLDLLLWMMGGVKSIYGEAVTRRKEKETEDAIAGILSFQSGATGILDMNVITEPRNLEIGIALFGEKGTISLGGPVMQTVKRCTVDGKELEEEMEKLLQDTNEGKRMYEAFITAILLGDARFLIPPHEMVRTLEVSFAFYESMKKKLPISLLSDRRAVTDLEEATEGGM